VLENERDETKLWWHERQVESLPSRRVFGALQAHYDAHRWTPEIAALGEFALRIDRCLFDLEHYLFRGDQLPSSQQLIDFALHHTPFRTTVTLGVIDMLSRLKVHRIPRASLVPPCGMTVEELRQLHYFRGQILTFREQKKMMDGWSPGAIKAELLAPRNNRVVLTGAGCMDYMSIEEFYQEDSELSLQFEQLEEHYAIYRCYPPGGDRDGRSQFDYMVGSDLIYLASFVRHLDWMLPNGWEQRGG